MSDDTDTPQKQLSLKNTRAYLKREVAEVERLIAKMDPETQKSYRETSKPHNALALLEQMESLLKQTDLWVEDEVARAYADAPEGSATETVGRELMAAVADLLQS